ncbi:hypothetical protein SARC_14282, partial [Sphaeroforma arctica JP610]
QAHTRTDGIAGDDTHALLKPFLRSVVLNETLVELSPEDELNKERWSALDSQAIASMCLRYGTSSGENFFLSEAARGSAQTTTNQMWALAKGKDTHTPNGGSIDNNFDDNNINNNINNTSADESSSSGTELPITGDVNDDVRGRARGMASPPRSNSTPLYIPFTQQHTPKSGGSTHGMPPAKYADDINADTGEVRGQVVTDDTKRSGPMAAEGSSAVGRHASAPPQPSSPYAQ